MTTIRTQADMMLRHDALAAEARSTPHSAETEPGEELEELATLPVRLEAITHPFGFDFMFLCPCCDGEYVHLGKHGPHLLAGNDNYESGTGLRGDAIAFKVWCETCNDVSEMLVAFHKGRLFFGARQADDEREDVEGR